MLPRAVDGPRRRKHRPDCRTSPRSPTEVAVGVRTVTTTSSASDRSTSAQRRATTWLQRRPPWNRRATITVASRMHVSKSHARPANGSRTSDPSGRTHRATRYGTVQRALHERGPLLDGGDHPRAKPEGASARTPSRNPTYRYTWKWQPEKGPLRPREKGPPGLACQYINPASSERGGARVAHRREPAIPAATDSNREPAVPAGRRRSVASRETSWTAGTPSSRPGRKAHSCCLSGGTDGVSPAGP